MSNAPMPSDPAAVEPATGESAPRAARRSHDAELVLAAVDRMDAALERERVKLDRLQSGLAALARTIAQAKIAMQPTAVNPAATGNASLDVVALLDELEHRVDAMLEIGGGPGWRDVAAHDQSPAVPPTADLPTEPEPIETPKSPRRVEPDRVPTVSGVVSRLGRASEEAPANAAPPVAEVSRKDVATLEAMVQALSTLDADNRQPAPTATKPNPEPPPRKPVMPDNELSAAAQTPPSLTQPRDSGAAAEPPPVPQTAAPKTSDQAHSDKRSDPLAPLNAMSAAEKIALFT
jgi:hypothetical protein